MLGTTATIAGMLCACSMISLSVAQAVPGTITNSDGNFQFNVESGKNFEFITGDSKTTLEQIQVDAQAIREDVDTVRREAACDNDGVAALASATVEATATTTEKVAEAVASAFKAINGQQTSALEALQALQQNMSTTHTASTIAMVEALQEVVSAGNSGGGGGGGGAHVVASYNNCPDTGCLALTSKITAVVQGDSNPGTPALQVNLPYYECHFTNKQFKKPLVYAATSQNGVTVECMIPQFDSSDLSKTWTARLQIFAGARAEIMYVDQENLADMDVLVSSVGPVISEIADQTVPIRDLKKDDDGAYLHVVTGIKIVDADSPASAFDVTVTAGSDRISGKLAAVDGEENMFTLTMTITEETSLAPTKITLKIVDNHDFETTRSFNLEMTTWAGFWANLEESVDTSNCPVCTNQDTFKTIAGTKANGFKWQVESNNQNNDQLSDGFGYTWQEGSSFDATSGLFTVPADGLYMINAVSRIDSGGQSGVKLIIDIDSWQKENSPHVGDRGFTDVGSLTATQSSMANKFATISVAGTLFLKKGQTIGVLFRFEQIPTCNAQIEKRQTAWGVAQVSVPSGSDQGFAVYPNNHVMDCCSWKLFKRRVFDSVAYNNRALSDLSEESMLANLKGGLFNLNNGMNTEDGVFTAPEDGIYRFNVNYRFSLAQDPGRYHRIAVAVNGYPSNGDTIDNGGCALIESQQQRTSNWVVGCFAAMNKGDTAEVAYAQADRSDWITDYHSSFTGVRLGPKSLPGFLAERHGTQEYEGSNQYFKVTGWTALERSQQDWVTQEFNNDGKGGKSFDGSDFTAPVAGVYAVEASFRFDDADDGYYRMVFAVNGEPARANNGHGIATLRDTDITYRYRSASFWAATVSGFVKMNKGDTGAIYVMSSGGKKWKNIGESSGFSMALIQAL